MNKKKYFKNNKINFLFVGQLIQRKGIKEILSAINKLSCSEKEKILIHIVGDGGLKKLIEKYQQKNVAIKYYGFVFGNKLSKIYCIIDPEPPKAREFFPFECKIYEPEIVAFSIEIGPVTSFTTFIPLLNL